MNPKIIKPERGVSNEPAPAPEGAARVVRNEAYLAMVDARAIVEAARQQSEAILLEARRQGEQVLEAAREQGYREGLAQWYEAVLSARAAREAAAAEHEAELLRLAVRVAGKIVGQELRTHPDTITGIVRECLRNVRSERLLIIQVNAEDVEQVRNSLGRLAPATGTARHVEVVADPAVQRGGCIVESELGVVDARLETQLQCLEEALLQAARK